MPPTTPDPSSADAKLRQQWERKVRDMKEQTAAHDWKGVDFRKLKASDIGVQFGPMMTEEQFKEYKKRAGGGVHVVKAPTENP